MVVWVIGQKLVMSIAAVFAVILPISPIAWAAGPGQAIVGFAAPTPGGSDPRVPWYTGHPEDCGQACTLQKGNENAALMARYITYKVQALDDLVGYDRAKQQFSQKPQSAGSPQSAGAADAFNSKGDPSLLRFCLSKEVEAIQDGSPSQAAAEHCYLRYRDNQLRILRELRTGTALTNRDLVALDSDRAGLISVADVVLGDSSGHVQGPDTPHVLSWSEAVKIGDQIDNRSVSLEKVNTDLYQRWLESLPHGPDCAQFALFKKIKRYPDQLDSEDLTVAMLDQNGNPMMSPKTPSICRAAQDKYQADVFAEGLKKTYDDNAKKQASLLISQTYSKAEHTRVDQERIADTKLPQDQKSGGLRKQKLNKSISYVAFVAARSDLVDATSRQLSKQQWGGQERAFDGAKFLGEKPAVVSGGAAPILAHRSVGGRRPLSIPGSTPSQGDSSLTPVGSPSTSAPTANTTGAADATSDPSSPKWVPLISNFKKIESLAHQAPSTPTGGTELKWHEEAQAVATPQGGAGGSVHVRLDADALNKDIQSIDPASFIDVPR